jgi:uronate dehydrogenase
VSDEVKERILITGAGGNMGRMLRSRLAGPGRVLRLLNRSPIAPAEPGEAVEIVTATVTDLNALIAAFEGVDTVIHLGGISQEAPFEEILETNVAGSYCVLEAARRQGVRRVLLASSNHAIGYTSRDDAEAAGILPADLPPRPDSFYGWGKTAMESLGRLYVDTYGMDVFCLRIGSCFPAPVDLRTLATWLSPDDAGRLVEACLSTDHGGYQLIWGVSRNSRRWWSLTAGEAIGYHPVDDAENFAGPLLAEFGEPDVDQPVHRLVGGQTCAVPLGERMN